MLEQIITLEKAAFVKLLCEAETKRRKKKKDEEDIETFSTIIKKKKKKKKIQVRNKLQAT